uniref:Uncharacterized protein n=1 Tax=Euplotes crassus TaxID=5936 RepID=A0A7S3KAH3_EUPCR|mmetsp:Transcript_15791/g.15552  ORF Transcript_15791/g.15552 Transcript_15791/m.15552 type:complete len:129 (+) Transcript_15791:1-387(+)
MEDSIISDDISSSDSNEGTETLNILTPTSDNQTEKITQKPGLHKSTEKTTKNKKGHEKSNIFDINMRKRKNDKLKDLCDSKPKYLPTMSNVKRVHKSHTSLKSKRAKYLNFPKMAESPFTKKNNRERN